MSTAERLCAAASGLGADFEAQFPSLTALRATAQTPGPREKIAVLAKNGIGKSTLIDLTVLFLLPKDNDAYAAVGGERREESVPAVLAPFLGGQQTVEEVESQGHVVVKRNPDPSKNTGHLERVRQTLAGYYSGNRREFGRHSLLLGVGARRGTTTQVRTQIGNDAVVACCIIPRSTDQLAEMTTETVKGMLADAEEEEERKLLHDQDFLEQLKLLEQLTGHNVRAQLKQTWTRLEVVLRGLAEQDTLLRQQGGSLLRHDVAQTVNRFKPTAFLGTRENLSSDLHFVREAVAQPMRALAGPLEEGLPLSLEELSRSGMMGMLIESIDITVPCRLLGSLVLVDMPGLDDTGPFANYNIKATMDAVQHVLMVPQKNLGSERGLLKALVSESNWMDEQLTQPESRGQLIVLHYPETACQNLSVVDLWEEGRYNADVEDNHESSFKEMKDAMLQETPATLSGEEHEKRVGAFLRSRAHFCTALPATFGSLALASAEDVMKDLEKEDAGFGTHWSAFRAHKLLVERTNMRQLLELLCTLSLHGDCQRMEEIRAESERQMAALEVDSEHALSQEHVQLLGKQLTKKLSQVANIDNYVQLAWSHQGDGARGGQQGVSTMESVAAKLLADLQAPMQVLLTEYTGTRLSDGAITQLVTRAINQLKDWQDPVLNMGHLRRLCNNRKMLVGRGTAVVGQICGALEVSSSQVWAGQREALLTPHREAAAAIGRIFRSLLSSFAPDEALQEFLGSERMWAPQLVARIEEEVLRVARISLVECGTLNGPLVALLRDTLKDKMSKASDNARARTHKQDFFPQLQDAMISALQTVRAKLPTKLSEMLRRHVHEELFSTTKLFVSIRKRSHGIARVEVAHPPAHPQPADASQGANAQAEGSQPDTPGSAAGAEGDAPPAAPATAAGPARRSRRGAAAEQHERQPCLWRAFYRFLCTAHTRVTGQEADNAERRRVLLQRLALLRDSLVKALKQYRSNDRDVCLRQMGGSLAHSALQHARLAQVLATKPEVVGVAARPVRLEVTVDPGSRTVTGKSFVATIGDLRLPGGLREDSWFELQDLVVQLVRGHQLNCTSDFASAAGPNNALCAAWSALKGHKLVQGSGSGVARVREVVAFQMTEDDEERMAEKLRRAGHAEPQQAAYLADFANDRQFAGLLELQYLAEASLPHGAAFLIWSAKREGERHIAYLLSREPLSLEDPATRTIQVFPLMMAAVLVDGVVRPAFQPLFRATRELRSLAGGSQASDLPHQRNGEPHALRKRRSLNGEATGESGQQTGGSREGGSGGGGGSRAAGGLASGGAPRYPMKWNDEEEVRAILAQLQQVPDGDDVAGGSKRPRQG